MSNLDSAKWLAVTILAMSSAAVLPAADAAKTTTIQGTVILNGKPLVGRILFHLDKGQFVGARLDEDGRFTIDRVPLGECQVTIEGKGVPESYASEKLSALKVKVAVGDNTFGFELASD